MLHLNLRDISGLYSKPIYHALAPVKSE